MRAIVITCLLVMPLYVLAQDNIIGFWQGKMKSTAGNYIFTLRIKPDYAENAKQLSAVAMHNRNGVNEVIELIGTLYSDNSVYFREKGDLQKRVDDGSGFSCLQFLLKFNRGEPELDGHWQAYRDFKRYRKGRLLLQRHLAKA
ncbi:MAG: hypothetical protein HKN87_15095 [Saprospiraceae bacterium]|nr:hypothetical protein [Saprospiraceae bacterium]